MIEFADLSSFQAGADLTKIVGAHDDRVLLKATEGLGYTNPSFVVWWLLAGTLGLARGAYHFGRPSQSSGEVEAQHFLAVVGAAGGLGPRDWLVLDIEDTDGTARAADYVARFTGWLASHGHPNGVVYSGAWYLNPAHITVGVPAPGWRRLHLADYSNHPDPGVLPISWASSQVVARQYTDAATTRGVPGLCDRSRVLSEWLPLEDDMPLTPQDAALVWKTPPPANATPPVHQADALHMLTDIYQKVGGLVTESQAIGAALSALAARVAALESLVDDLTSAPAAPPLGAVQVSGQLQLTSASPASVTTT